MPTRLDSAPERTTGSPLTSAITSPGCRPALAAALLATTCDDQRAVGALQAEGVGQSPG